MANLFGSLLFGSRKYTLGTIAMDGITFSKHFALRLVSLLIVILNFYPEYTTKLRYRFDYMNSSYHNKVKLL